MGRADAEISRSFHARGKDLQSMCKLRIAIRSRMSRLSAMILRFRKRGPGGCTLAGDSHRVIHHLCGYITTLVYDAISTYP